MRIELLGNLGPLERQDRTLLFCSKNRRLSDLAKPVSSGRVSKIAMYALPSTPECMAALASVGVEPAVLCNTDPNIEGRQVLRHYIHNTWELIAKKDDYHFIVPVTGKETLNSILRQLVLHGVTNFGFMVEVKIPDFGISRSGEALIANYIKSLNKVIGFHTTDDYWINDYFWHYANGIGWWNCIYSWVSEDIAQIEKTELLDIGPGIGIFSALVKGMREDIHIEWLNLEPIAPIQSSGIEDNVIVADIETDKLPVGHLYDIIVMTEVIEHFRFNPLPTLKKIGSHLKSGGVFYLSCPHWKKSSPYPSWEAMPVPGTKLPFQFRGHNYEFRHDELLEMCHQAGFVVLQEAFAVYGNSNLKLKLK